MNENRRDRAESVLRLYADLMGVKYTSVGDDELATDIIADIMHFLDNDGWGEDGIKRVLEAARRHYDAEKEGVE